MADKITKEIIDYVSILAKLELSGREKEQVRQDMNNILDYMDKLNELNTENVEALAHLFPADNVFREDIVVNEDRREDILSNAPLSKNGSFQVPKTVESV